MGGASSWFAILAICGFMTSVWLAGRLSRLIGVSSIVLEVAVGLVLGPGVGKLIPGELTECYDSRVVDCDTRKDHEKIARKGYEYCDLDAYIKADRYAPGATWANGPYNTGFWGTLQSVELDGTTFCIDKAFCGRRMLLSKRSDPEEDGAEGDGSIESSAPARMLAKKDKKGKLLDGEDYSGCLKASCELKLALDCATTPDIFTLVGHTGVAMMIFESGMHFDFEQAKVVGPWACAVAVLGTFLPLVTGCAMCMAFGFTFMEGMSAGTSLAPTSVGIALKLLHEAHALQLYFGQAVMTAAFVDDVLSLILFSVLFSLGDDIDIFTFMPLCGGLIFMAVSGIMCIKFWPSFIPFLLSKIPETKPDAKVTRHDEVMWIVMFALLLVYAEITHECGTHLWGCFIAGMSFAQHHPAHHIWVKQVKRVTCWFLRVFFACTLAWSIPIDDLFNIDSFWKGTLMGIGPCIATKVLCGPFMGDSRWVIGWAMVGRAEFAYFIGIMAKSMKMMPEKLFAILIWALLYATIFAPLVFRWVLVGYMAKQEAEEVDAAPTHCSSASKMGSSIHNESGHLPDLYEEKAEEKKLEEKKTSEKLRLDCLMKDDECSRLNKSLQEAQLKIDDLIMEVEKANSKEVLRPDSPRDGDKPVKRVVARTSI
jgi:Kef-type K+ transport system membrane component KefB